MLGLCIRLQPARPARPTSIPTPDCAIDNQPNTAWNTQTYYADTLNKAGVGLYIDAKPKTTARVLRIITTTPGFTATIYGRNNQPPVTWPDPGWNKISQPTKVVHKQDIHLTPRAPSTATTWCGSPTSAATPSWRSTKSRCIAEGERARQWRTPDSAACHSSANVTSRSSSRSYGIPLAANREA